MDHASLAPGQLAGGLNPADEPAITEREVNALLARASYASATEAADAIGIDLQTLHNTLWHLRRKLGVATDLQAYHMLVAKGREITLTVTRSVRLLDDE